jgi:type IV secretory pathway VirJ component
LPIVPEVMKMPSKMAVCIYGSEDEESVCPSLTAMRAPVRVLRLPGDHHFDGAYDKLAAHILASVDTPVKDTTATHQDQKKIIPSAVK